MRCLNLSVCLFGIIFCLFLHPTLCQSKSFTIPETNIDCTLFQNGNVSWNEIRTFSFQGFYHYGVITLPRDHFNYLHNIRVDEIALFNLNIPYRDNLSREQYTYWIEKTEYNNWLHFYFSALDTQKKFRFSYVIDGSIDLYEDYGQFIWSLDEGRFSTPIEHLFATFHLEKPIPKEDLNLWIHGPEHYIITYVDEKTITLSMDDIPINTEVEVRFLIPGSYFTMEKNWAGEIHETAIREEAFREKYHAEKRLLELQTRKERAKKQFLVGGLLSLLALLLLGYLLFTILRFGLGYSLSRDFEPITFPDNDLSPGEVSYLMGFNRYKVKAIQTTLLDLLRRKYIQVDWGNGKEKGNNDLILIENSEVPNDQLIEYEKILLKEILFQNPKPDEPSTITFKELKKQLLENPKQTADAIKRMKQSFPNKLLEKKYFDLKNQKFSENMMTLCITVVAGFVFYYLLYPRHFLWLVPIVGAILLFYGSMPLFRRTPTGKEVTQRYLSHRRFLRNYKQLDAVEEYEADLWERYFIFSVILESLKQFFRLFYDKFKPIKEDESILLNKTSSLRMLKYTYSLSFFINGFSLVNTWVYHIVRKKQGFKTMVPEIKHDLEEVELNEKKEK